MAELSKVDCVICGAKVFLCSFNLLTYDDDMMIKIHKCCKEVIAK